jgi:importin-4
LDYSELREYTHGFFSNVAEILGDSFTQVTRVFKSLFNF